MSVKNVRGMRDILPKESILWTHSFSAVTRVLEQYGYQFIATPIVEHLSLFQRLIGEQTDVINKEMYVFDDRSGEHLALRPEGTAGCMRAILDERLVKKPTKLWYWGPMFRYERPQKGRLRQFYQLGLELLGLEDPVVDFELLLLLHNLWITLGLSKDLTLEINNIGCAETRVLYSQELRKYFSVFSDKLDALDQQRLKDNPMRLLDSKSLVVQEYMLNAPRISHFVKDTSSQHFEELCRFLEAFNISYKVNPYLVRGLDYYNQTVFEWKTMYLGAQSTLCGGGRFDALATQLSPKKEIPAVGCSIGWERLMLLLEDRKTNFYTENVVQYCDVYVFSIDSAHQTDALKLANNLRLKHADLSIQTYLSNGSMKSKFKAAERENTRYCLILGEEEWGKNSVILKNMLQKQEQVTVDINQLDAAIDKIFNS